MRGCDRGWIHCGESGDCHATGATYSFGLGANNAAGTNTPYFTVVSLGFDDTGTATTITRKVYMTKIIRFPYSTVSILGTYTAGTFTDGETITEATSGATAVVVGNQGSGTVLVAKSVVGTPGASEVWTGGTSGATFLNGATATPVTYTLITHDEKVPTGPNLVARIALSDYIYQKDATGGGNSGTAPTFTAPSGFIVNTGGASSEFKRRERHCGYQQFHRCVSAVHSQLVMAWSNACPGRDFPASRRSFP